MIPICELLRQLRFVMTLHNLFTGKKRLVGFFAKKTNWQRRQRSQDVALLGIIDIQPVLALHTDLESDLLNLLQRPPAKQPHGI